MCPRDCLTTLRCHSGTGDWQISGCVCLPWRKKTKKTPHTDNWMLDTAAQTTSPIRCLQAIFKAPQTWISLDFIHLQTYFTSFFFFPTPTLLKHLICKNHMFTFEIKVSFFPSPSPFFHPHLKMDPFHYASQQRAASARAAHSKHTD